MPEHANLSGHLDSAYPALSSSLPALTGMPFLGDTSHTPLPQELLEEFDSMLKFHARCKPCVAKCWAACIYMYNGCQHSSLHVTVTLVSYQLIICMYMYIILMCYKVNSMCKNILSIIDQLAYHLRFIYKKLICYRMCNTHCLLFYRYAVQFIHGIDATN